MYECQGCGRKFKAIEADWVKRLDPEAKRMLWRCPNCGRMQRDAIHFLHDRDLDYKERGGTGAANRKKAN